MLTVETLPVLPNLSLKTFGSLALLLLLLIGIQFAYNESRGF